MARGAAIHPHLNHILPCPQMTEQRSEAQILSYYSLSGDLNFLRRLDTLLSSFVQTAFEIENISLLS